jgi:hypothetical protein
MNFLERIVPVRKGMAQGTGLKLMLWKATVDKQQLLTSYKGQSVAHDVLADDIQFK